MKFFHLSDLHLGKRLNEFSLIEDQRFILNQILEKIDLVKPDGIIIAGDVYDKGTPSTEAITLLDEFLFAISQKNLPIYLIGGNHDSQERLSFGHRLLNKSKLYISPAYNGELEKISLQDEFGTLNVYLLPFIKPSLVRRFFPEEKIETYTDAVEKVINSLNLNKTQRNVLVTHQFVTGATTCDSEELSVGGTDNVDSFVFEDFDYVALGHIHSPQNVKPNIRYCGTPLKYSFSEANHKKSITVVELKEKGNLIISQIPLTPLRDLREIKGTYQEVTFRENYANTNLADYVKITLTDEENVLDAVNLLRVIYPNLMKLEYDNTRTKSIKNLETIKEIEKKSPLELFNEFYIKQNNQPLSSEQKEYVSKLIESIWEDKQ